MHLNCNISGQVFGSRMWFINDTSTIVMIDCSIFPAYIGIVVTTYCDTILGVYNIVLKEFTADDFGVWTCSYNGVRAEAILDSSINFCKCNYFSAAK